MTSLRSPLAAALVVAAAVTLSACGALRDLRDGEDSPAPTSGAVPAADAMSTAAPVDPSTPGWEPQSTPCAAAGTLVDGCGVSGYDDRPFSVSVPSGYDGGEELPLVVFLHGGGGNAENAQATTCPGGDLADAGCLMQVGEREGFITVFATGYAPTAGSPLRTWNAGGGGDFACVSGAACADGSDDVAYLREVIAEVEREFRVDPGRVYLMGFSNGAAMAHRMACEAADVVTAIAAVSGANAFASNAACMPTMPVAVLHVHGTADVCWSYVSSTAACADFQDQPKVGVLESTAAWVDTLDCDVRPERSLMADADPGDGTITRVASYDDCDGGVEVRLLTVEGGGHVFPQGDKVRDPVFRDDVASQDFGAQELWEWLATWSR